MQSNFFLGFSTFLDIWGQKIGFWGPRPSPTHPDRNFEPDPGLHAPNWIFWSHFRPNAMFFDHFCKVDFFRTFRVFGVHRFLQMWGLHRLPCTPKDAPWKVSMEEHSFSPRSWIWDQNLPKNNFQVGPKAIFELVRPNAIFVSACNPFWRFSFVVHSRFGSSWVSSKVRSLGAPIHTKGCALKS